MSDFASDLDIKHRKCMSNNDLMLVGINYKFELKDLPKYSQTINEKDLEDKFSKSVLGKQVPTMAYKIRKMEDMRNKLK